jgi:2-polyprenyl-6-methoxyphenol hydroxylase-like FAD-dependent oxidoreductase
LSISNFYDVAIVGAGLAGASAAAVLGRKGLRVVLLDSQETYAPCFKAEKIEPDQVRLLRKLGLLDQIQPFASSVHEVITARGMQILRVRHLEQYGIFYHQIVEAVRSQIPSAVTWKTSRVRSISPNADVSRIALDNDEEVSSRLVILACGTGGRLHAELGISKRMIGENQSLAIGLNIVPADGRTFPFESLTYFPDDVRSQSAFLTLFPIREVMRANFFVYRQLSEEWVNDFRRDPKRQLLRTFAQLQRFTGPLRIASKIEMCPIHLYKAEGYLRPGLVLIGDAYQSACPTTGLGLSKVLTDVDVLCMLVPEWLKTPGTSVKKISRYYRFPRKLLCDVVACRKASFIRHLSTESSLLWNAYRELRYVGMRLVGLTQHCASVSPIEVKATS